MINEQEIRSCAGCGTKIQTENPERAGYVPASALQKERIVCQRCFKITHYNEVSSVELGDGDFLKMLHSISQSEGLVVKLIDMFDVNGSWIHGIHRFVGHNPVLLVGNKMDLFPQNINPNRLRNWLQHTAKELGLKPVDIVFCSAEKGTGIDALLQTIDKLRRRKNVYIVGTTNVGKSTLINRILKTVGVSEDHFITTSRFPGTTLDFIDIPLEDGQSLFDTPGIMNRNQMAHYVTDQDLKIISPKNPLKPKVYQLNDQQTLFFGGLARLDFVKGERQPFVCYFANELSIHRTKLERADDLYKNHVGELLSPPSPEQLETWQGLVKHTFRLPKEETDIVFSGLGWVTVKGTSPVVHAYAPKGVSVSIRKALI